MFIRRLSVLMLILASFSVWAAGKPVELYAVDYPPYMIVDKQGVASGIDVEVTQAAFAAVGVETVILTAPWKRILKSLKHGRISGALTCSKRADRLNFITYSDQVSEANQVAVMAKDVNDQKLVNYEDMQYFKVIAVEGWGIQKELVKSGIKHDITQEMDNGLKSIIYRDIDIFYSGELTALYRARQLGLQDKIKTKRFADKKSSTFHLCLSKAHPQSEALVKQFNEGLKKIKASGDFDAIYKKYL